MGISSLTRLYISCMGKKSSSYFQDIRLDKTCDAFIESITRRYSSVLRTLGEDRNAETRYANFIRNPKVNSERILQHHWKQCSADWSAQHLLVISDTSTLSFKVRSDRESMNYTGTKTKQTGFNIHPSLLVNAANGGLYGMGGLKILPARYPRTEKERQQKKERNAQRWKTPFEEKERYKWFSSPRQAVDLAPAAATYTLVGDREADIYDLIARTLNQGWEFVYRNRGDRSLATAHQTLYRVIENWPVLHHHQFTVSATAKRSKHEAKAAIKYGRVTIKRPHYHRDKTLTPTITLQVIEVKELPESVIAEQEPVHWILLTSHPVSSIEQALQIIQWYRWRWMIEQLFRSLKTKGLNIENSEVQTVHALNNLTTLALLGAVQIMQLVNSRDGQTNQSIADAFSPAEQKCLVKINQQMLRKHKTIHNPYPEQSMAFAAWIIARLGGWNGRASERPPGPITMVKGLTRFFHTFEGFALLL